jgi:hypothetical protein
MGNLFTAYFWKDLLERGVKTAAQFTLGGLALGEGVDAFAVDWQLGLGFALTGFVLSALTSIASVGIATRGTASVVAAVSPEAEGELVDAIEADGH